MTQNRELIEKIVAAMACASTDITRYHINGVLLEPTNSCAIKIVAVDGHRMIIDRAVLDFPLLTKKAYIKRELLPILKAALKAYKHGFSLEVRDDSTLIIAGEYFIALEKGESFPRYEQLLPTFTPSYEIAFNAKYLYELAASLGSKKDTVVKLSIKDKTSPILVSCSKNQTGEAVLMPCRF